MCTHRYTLDGHTSSPSTWLFQQHRKEWGGGYYSSTVINIRCTFSGMQRQWWGLVIDGGGHYISLALVYLSLPPQDTNKPCCLQWTIQQRSTQIENRYCASHLCYWHIWAPQGQNKHPSHYFNIWIMVIRPVISLWLKLSGHYVWWYDHKKGQHVTRLTMANKF